MSKSKTEEKYSQLYNKYKKMASTKTPFQVSSNILTPTMGEMLEEDLSYEALLQTTGDLDGSGNPTKAAFYLDPPFTEELGYDKDLDAMLIEAPVYKHLYNGKDVQWSWCLSDGDTLTYKVKDINAGTDPIEMNGQSFKTFEEYFNINIKGSNSNAESNSKFSIRFVGINCAEIPHFEANYTTKELLSKNLLKVKFKDIKNNSAYHYWRYPTDSRYDYEYKYKERNDDEIMYFIAISTTEGTSYHEIVRHKGSAENYMPIPTGDLDHSGEAIETVLSNFKLDAPSIEGWNAKTDVALLIIAKDETQKSNIADAYKAQNALKTQLEACDYKTRVVLDCKTQQTTTTFTSNGIALFSLFYAENFIKSVWDQMHKDMHGLNISGYSYGPYGADVYGRFLSAVYSKTQDGKWINLNKYVLANSSHTVAIPDYSGHPELNNKELSDAFQIWSYDINRFRWLDSFEELTEESYKKRIDIHEKLSGMKFCNIRDNTILIGDTLMLIPPTNIRSVTQTTYEKTPLLRSKGQITKGGNHNESILELTLYFAGDHGINGIPYKVTLPSGEEVTYYMNGLRSLVSQFKLTPFLPIENEYINDVLNIEAVSLLNLQVTTVPEYPQMLQAVLTVREFNYRLFMPDLPLGIETQESLSQNALAETNPIFAKAFQWEVFRYYYQRLLLAGETIQNFTYNTAEYNTYLYRSITALKPTSLCDSNISFYIPDIDWLDKALARKKDRDEAIIEFNPIELTQNTRDFAKTIGDMADDILPIATTEGKEAFIKYITESEHFDSMRVEKELKPTNTEKHYIQNSRISASLGINPILTFYKPIHDTVERGLLKTGLFSAIQGEESITYQKNDSTNEKEWQTVIWSIKAKLGDLSKKLTSSEISALKEFIALNLDTGKEAILKDDSLVINIHITADKDGNVLTVSYDDTFFSDVLKNLKSIGNNELTNADQNAMNDEDYDYRDPIKMPFVPLIEDIVASEMSISLSNLFTETKLKAVDGISGQYVGGQDSTINLKIITCDKLVVATLATLQDISFQFANEYKRIMACTPIRIKSDFTQLYGINEVAVEMIDINTIENMPGAYEIVMRLSSVDRTTRQRETLRKMDFTSNGGFVGTGEAGKQSIKSYFELEDVLSEVELYPDLEIPTLAELKLRGYAYVRYSLSNSKRVYPDPDFYMVYASSYTAAIMKAQIKDYFESLSDEETDTEELEKIELYDIETSEKFIAKLDEAVGLHLIGQNKAADITDEQIDNINSALKKAEKNNKNSSKSQENAKNAEKALKFLMASNVTDGWQLKPTWTAPLCDPLTNNLISQMPKAGAESSDRSDHSAAYKLKTTRRDIIKAIDAILSKPINMKSIEVDIKSYSKERQEEKIINSIRSAVNDLFISDENGKKLHALLNPLVGKYSISGDTYESAELTEWIKGFVYAAACVCSSEKDFDKKFMQIDKTNGEWGPRMWFNELTVVHNWNNDHYHNIYVPLCRVGDTNVGIPNIKGLKNKELEEHMINDAINRGTVFGPFAIKIYTVDELINISTPELNIKYVSDEEYPLYKHTIKDGFLDPYYNKLKEDDDELIKYKKGIMLNSKVSAQAFLRNCLVWLRKLILDGLFISDVDILAEDLLDLFTKNNSIFESGKLPPIDSEKDSDKAQIKKVIQAMTDNFFASMSIGKEEREISDLYLMYASMCDLLPKSFCARMIYPIFLAATDGSPLIYNDMKVRNYNALESATNASLSGNVDDVLSRQVCTFFNAMAGQGMIDIQDTEKSWTDMSQKITNSVSQEMYLEFAKNPKVYTMHSYYDMLMNDKRGRLVRAFPTYYMILIDEGRKIGYWKLHDNFYNMSSISDIQVVKSRKMAADTATVTMTNAYNSYATEHDNSTKYKYADLYGVKDVFDSIFSPKRYYEKAEEVRQNAQVKDKVVLKPGVRIHIRMGYSADAARIPVMFNGRITEVNAGEVVDIVAQGDGIELLNPLNTLGNIETNQIDTAQSLFFPDLLTDFRGSFSKGGLSPKNLLASILCAEYGGLEGIINHVSNGRYFNTNPFGITHFGDMRFTEIFSQGETAQNLYEVSDDDLLRDMNTISKEPAKKRSTPIINTSLYDKTFWDLMHMSARAGKDYIAAVRDFGFRSTIFLGQNNHYYAYGYKEVNGNIFEKRKPFQQYHYIEPYNDIIYNTIKASESDIRTNATGIWQSTNATFGRKSSTVGPLYLDINIYPEYQKSMTYDTGLLADGNGGFDFNLFTKAGESHVFSGKIGQDDKTYDDKVNVKLAERMTINALKETVKDMYQGEVCILGSPAIKPFDRIHIFDSQEDMFGDFEVETVIHSLNAYTGFTTTIHPDLIVRHKENKTEMAKITAVDTLVGCFMATTMLQVYKHAFSRTNSTLIKNVMKSSIVSSTSSALVKTVANTSLFRKNLNKLDSKVTKAIVDNLNKVIDDAGNHFNSIFMKSMQGLTDSILKININEASSAKDLVKCLKQLEDLNMNKFKDNFDSMIDSAKNNGLTDLANELSNDMNEVIKSYDDMMKELDMSDLFKELANDKNLSKEVSKIDKDMFEYFSKKGYKITDLDDIKKFNKLFQSDEILKAITSEGNEAVQKSFMKGMKGVINFASSSAEKGGLKGLQSLFTKGTNVLSNLALKLKTSPFTMNVISIIAQLLITETIGLVTRSLFESWFDSLQTLTIYPMKQYGKNFTAGITGAKACTYSSPTSDGWNSIQGMIIQAYESIGRLNPVMKFITQEFVDSFIIDTNSFKTIANTYKANLGLIENDSMSEEDIVENLYKTVSTNMDNYGTSKHAVMTRARVQSFDKTNEKVSTSFNKYAIRNINVDQLSSNTKISKLIALDYLPSIQSYIADGRLKIAHNHTKDALPAKILINGKNVDVNILPTQTTKKLDWDYPDLPMLQKDASTVLKTILDETYLMDELVNNKYVFHSGTVPNSNDWRSTGFHFILEASNKNVTKAFDKAKKTLNAKYKVFEYSKSSSGNYYTIKLYPPIY